MNLFKAQIIGLDSLKAQIETASNKVKREVDYAIGESAKEFAARAYANALIDDSVFTRQLVNSIKVEKDGYGSYAVVASAPHSGFVEFGTKNNYTPQTGFDDVAARFKGSKPANKYGNLYQAILAWVKKKNIGRSETGEYRFKVKKSVKGDYIKSVNKLTRRKKNAESIAFAITMKIAKQGRKAKPFFFKNIVPVRTMLEAELKRILDGI